MINISVDKLKPGMEVAKSIYNNDTNVLISAGTKLKASYIKRLKELGVESIYIAPKELPKLDVPETISEETRVETVQTVAKVMEDLKSGKGLNNQAIREQVNNIVAEILASEEQIIHLNDIRNYNNYIFYHSVNVTVLSLLIALEMGYNEMELKKIATGALLHDIGMILIEDSFAKNRKDFSKAEYRRYKKHTEYGYRILTEHDKVNIKVRHIAYQHHEKLDGTGYPRQLVGDDILDYAQLVAVANIYDSLTSDANNSKKILPNQALNVLESLAGLKLNQAYITALKKHIALYPISSLVLLNNGQTALVIKVKQDNLTEPIVKIIKDKAGNLVKEDKIINLAKTQKLEIKKVTNLFS